MTDINSPVSLSHSKKEFSYDHSLLSQRRRILKHFKCTPTLSTFEARNKYGIPHPGGRMMELRKLGHRIETIWTYQADNNGITHRIGLYVYHGKGDQ